MASNPRLLKQRVGNGRVYIRPIQRDLSKEVKEPAGVRVLVTFTALPMFFFVVGSCVACMSWLRLD